MRPVIFKHNLGVSGRPDDDEGYLVTLDQRALDRLRARRRRGESYSEVIVRLAEASRGA
jgi:hypothetical protein